MTGPSHQVVVQFPYEAVPDLGTLTRSEDLLRRLLAEQHLYDGHEIGSGTVNFLIRTADRAALLQAMQAGCDWLSRPDVRIASQRLDDPEAGYKSLWPPGDKRDFRLFYGPDHGGWPVPTAQPSEPEWPTPFLPLTDGNVEGTAYQHRVHHLGQLRLPSGRLEACDPFIALGEGLVVDVPPGDYPVYVTVADVSEAQDWSHQRQAYLSVVLAETTPSSFSYLSPVGWQQPEPGAYYGVGVDAGTVCFVDAGAVSRSMPEPDSWYDEVMDTGRGDSWLALLESDQHLIPGCANIVMPLAPAGENVIMCYSGWGDGFYPLVGTYDVDGRLVGVHIDLQVDEAPGEPTS